ncbi:hypothetical protein [Mucilaginibacter antarcticus]|uniref:MORN repeat protein n=1 Tax=Mucilaginibacter antarcticus TaxID=1855725 RepID=A0ABW5XRG6_9SPHI
MKKLLLCTLIIFCLRDAMAQQIVERRNKIVGDVTERVQTIIEADKQVKDGSYRALYKRKVLASGKYVNDKKAGIWHYFDRDGILMQNYDYDKNELLFEAPEDAGSPFSYNVDDTIKATDKVTQPVKLGGRYFGYLPLLKLFVLPKELRQEPTVRYLVTFELLISPMGRLADIIIHVKYGTALREEMTYTIDPDLLKEHDRTFIPATFNAKPIASQIKLVCSADVYGLIDMF